MTNAALEQGRRLAAEELVRLLAHDPRNHLRPLRAALACFFAAKCPLSNFHISTFKLYPDYGEEVGHIFTSIEQYFQWCKALEFNDFASAKRIYSSKGADPLEAKLLGQQVAGFSKSKWRLKCNEVCYFMNFLCISNFST